MFVMKQRTKKIDDNKTDRVVCYLPPETHARLKALAALRRDGVEALMNDIVVGYLDAANVPATATFAAK